MSKMLKTVKRRLGAAAAMLIATAIIRFIPAPAGNTPQQPSTDLAPPLDKGDAKHRYS